MKQYRVPLLTDKIASYDMIQLHTDLPDQSGPRLQLLYAFLNQQPSLSAHGELYTLATSLVQLGLDTHDMVDTNTERRPEKEMRSRQLKILAGDYFSAQFYSLLAKAGQIDMITRISGAVCEVNRLKVNLYMRMRQLKVTADEYFSLAVQLRSGLFQHFAGVLGGTMARLWPDLLEGVSRCEVALDEIKRSECPKRFDKSWAYWHVLQVGTEEERHQLSVLSDEQNFSLIKILAEKYHVRNLLAAKLKQSAESVIALASKLESDKLIGELGQMIEDLTSRLTATMPALNETR